MLQKLAAANTSVNIGLPDEFNNLSGIGVNDIISTAIAIMFLFAGLIFFFMLVWGGISWVTSGGDKGKTEAARNRITAALIGLVIVFSAWAITVLLETIFGVNILKFNIPKVVN